METAKGRVQSVHDGVATVVVDQPVACKRCASGRGCGAGLMTGAEGPRRIDVRIPHGMTLESGDEVSLTVESQQLLRAALFAYGIPLLAMLCALGAASISGMAASDLASIGIAFAGLAGGVAVSRYYLRRESACDHLIPVIDGHSDRTPA